MSFASKTFVCVIAFCFAISAFGSLAEAQKGERLPAGVSHIEDYAKGVDKLTRRAPHIVAADVAAFDGDKPMWKLFASEKALDKHRSTDETYSIAYGWKKDRKIVAVTFTTFSPSGDWAQYTSHFFRTDGTTAKIKAELRTFYGEYIVVREQYFSPRGNLLFTRSKYFDLSTRKPIKPNKDQLDSGSSAFSDTFYKSVGKLPFAALITDTKRK